MRFRFKQERQAKTISVNSTISLILEEYGLRDSMILGKITTEWKELVGELIAAHSIPDRIFRNILFVSVDHSVYSNEIHFMKDIILKKVNERFGSEVIKGVKPEIKKLDWQKRSFKKVHK